MIIFAVVWAICYYRGKAPNFVLYGPIVLAALSVLQTLPALMNGNEIGVVFGLASVGVYLGLAVIARKSKPQVEDAVNEWSDTDKKAFRRLMDAQR